jgi:acyl-coenzyme A thioesterase PaaI-like protein
MTPGRSLSISVLNKLKEIASAWPGTFEIPPKVFQEFGGEFVDWVENKSLSVNFPMKPGYANPKGILQGGIIVTMFDNVMGPLGYLAAKLPVSSTQFFTTFIRPVFVSEPFIRINATITESTQNFMYISGEAYTWKNKLAALCQCTMIIQKPN